jgi:hypothetical protein
MWFLSPVTNTPCFRHSGILWKSPSTCSRQPGSRVKSSRQQRHSPDTGRTRANMSNRQLVGGWSDGEVDASDSGLGLCRAALWRVGSDRQARYCRGLPPCTVSLEPPFRPPLLGLLTRCFAQAASQIRSLHVLLHGSAQSTTRSKQDTKL